MYHLSDVANASIPQDIRSQFHRDENDRVLFFTAPPLDVPRVPAKARVYGHSLKYLAAKLKDADALAEARKERDKRLAEMSGEKRKRDDEEFEKLAEEVEKAKIRALEAWNKDMERGTLAIYERMFGADGKAVMEEERLRLEKVHAQTKLDNEASAKREEEMKESLKVRIYR